MEGGSDLCIFQVKHFRRRSWVCHCCQTEPPPSSPPDDSLAAGWPTGHRRTLEVDQRTQGQFMLKYEHGCSVMETYQAQNYPSSRLSRRQKPWIGWRASLWGAGPLGRPPGPEAAEPGRLSPPPRGETPGHMETRPESSRARKVLNLMTI